MPSTSAALRAKPAGLPRSSAQSATDSPSASPARAAVVFRLPVRVYWEDTDAGGIVFYANYLKFFERARTEWLRALGVHQQAMRERSGAIFVVTHTSTHYRAPARLDDALEVTVAVQHTGRASLQVAQQAWRGGTLLAEGEVRIGCVEAATLKPCRIPADVLELI